MFCPAPIPGQQRHVAFEDRSRTTHCRSFSDRLGQAAILMRPDASDGLPHSVALHSSSISTRSNCENAWSQPIGRARDGSRLSASSSSSSSSHGGWALLSFHPPGSHRVSTAVAAISP